MRSTITFLISLFILHTVSRAQTYVVPPANEATLGNGSFLGPLSNSVRTYQWLINENQLTGLAGQTINGISLRLLQAASAAWPPSTAVYSTYDIYIGPGILPANRSLADFSSHFSAPKTQVRSGSLTIDASSFPIGSTPNPFGSNIEFSTPYVYTGGHLTIEIRHSTSTGGSTSTEAITSSGSGYGTNFSACWASTIDANSGSSGNFSILRFSTSGVVPLKLLAFDARLQNNDALLRWTTEQEINTSHFVLERSSDGRNYTPIGNINSAGTTGGSRQYSYTDQDISGSGYAVLFYRLKMVDIDQRFTYSPVSVINISKEAAVVWLYPNPVGTRAALQVAASVKETISFRIINAAGQPVQSGGYNLQKGNNRFELETAKLPAGQYFLVLEGTGTNERIGFVKQ
jgi:hypothetical protein